MVEYLKGVNAKSIVIIAIKDSTYGWYWKQEWITYVDSYGSVTHQDVEKEWLLYNPDVHTTVGCPFTVCKFNVVLVVIKTDNFNV